ncbi:MAG: phosphotransferase [Oxalobacter sp.]|nr:phosphotransferase [Oxalobacter sp.]
MSTTASNIASDSRLVQLLPWLQSLTAFKLDVSTIRPASSDASFRRYFRVDSDKDSYIVMDAPPDKEKIEPFIHVDELFKESGVAVPEILAKNIEEGFLLLSDLGSSTYLAKLTENNADQLYREALHALVRIQMVSRPGMLPEYDRDALLRELKLFPEWYIAKHLGRKISPERQAVLDKAFDILLANNLAQPQVFVHRDYHSRNLMYLEQGNPGILDFQDALYGPVTYDLVSLLKDAYVEWDEARVLDWVIRYWESARKVGLPVNPDIDQFYRDFEFMGLQRHLKVLGIFARLYHRDGKENYLKDIPLVMKYASKTAHRYSELAPLARLLDELQDIKADATYSF